MSVLGMSWCRLFILNAIKRDSIFFYNHNLIKGSNGSSNNEMLAKLKKSSTAFYVILCCLVSMDVQKQTCIEIWINQ